MAAGLSRYKSFTDQTTLPAADLNGVQDQVITWANARFAITGLLTTAAALTFAGAYATTITFTAATTVTFPTTGTLATLAGVETLSGKRINLRNQGTGVYDVEVKINETLTAARTFTLKTGDVSRILDLSSLATGDILYYDGTQIKRLAIGSANQLLTVSGGVPVWAAAPASAVTSVFGRTGAVAAVAGDYGPTLGGTGQTAYTLGDILYSSATDTLAKLAGNTTTTRKFLHQTGTGAVSAAPTWDTVTKTDVGLGNVENTALSTWAGSANITTLGTVGTGTWQGTGVGDTYLAADVARMNQATNGSHTFWQRGTGAFTANNAYAADRKQIILAGTDTISVSQEATTKPANARYSSALTFTLGTGAGASRYKERLVISDGFHHLLGEVISIRLAVRSNAASSVRAVITTDGTGGTSSYSSYHAGNSAFADLTVTNITVPSDATYIDFGVTLEATATVYTSNWMLNRGAIAANFQALPPAEELQRCQRYYEILGGTTNLPRFEGYAGGTERHSWPLVFATPKGGTPTATKNGTWNVSNVAAGDPDLSYTASASLISPYVTPGGAGAIMVAPDGADDTITIAWNP